VARTVLRGPGGGNVARLPDYANPMLGVSRSGFYKYLGRRSMPTMPPGDRE